MACSGSWKNMQRVPGSSAGEGGWLELALEGQASPDDMRSLEEVDHFRVSRLLRWRMCLGKGRLETAQGVGWYEGESGSAEPQVF